MNGSRNWLGWIGLGLGALAVVIALFGGRFGAMFASGAGTWNVPQAYTQQRDPSQNNAPQEHSQQDGRFQNNAPQGGQLTPNAAGQRGSGKQQGDVRRGGGEPSGGGRNEGGWFGFPFKLRGWLQNAAFVVILVALGLYLLRGRGVMGNRPVQATQGATQEPRSPTGESYVDEAGNSTE